jgi:hypothetical protein
MSLRPQNGKPLSPDTGYNFGVWHRHFRDDKVWVTSLAGKTISVSRHPQQVDCVVVGLLFGTTWKW